MRKPCRNLWKGWVGVAVFLVATGLSPVVLGDVVLSVSSMQSSPEGAIRQGDTATFSVTVSVDKDLPAGEYIVDEYFEIYWSINKAGDYVCVYSLGPTTATSITYTFDEGDSYVIVCSVHYFYKLNGEEDFTELFSESEGYKDVVKVTAISLRATGQDKEVGQVLTKDDWDIVTHPQGYRDKVDLSDETISVGYHMVTATCGTSEAHYKYLGYTLTQDWTWTIGPDDGIDLFDYNVCLTGIDGTYCTDYISDDGVGMIMEGGQEDAPLPDGSTVTGTLKVYLGDYGGANSGGGGNNGGGGGGVVQIFKQSLMPQRVSITSEVDATFIQNSIFYRMPVPAQWEEFSNVVSIKKILRISYKLLHVAEDVDWIFSKIRGHEKKIMVRKTWPGSHNVELYPSAAGSLAAGQTLVRAPRIPSDNLTPSELTAHLSIDGSGAVFGVYEQSSPDGPITFTFKYVSNPSVRAVLEYYVGDVYQYPYDYWGNVLDPPREAAEYLELSWDPASTSADPQPKRDPFWGSRTAPQTCIVSEEIIGKYIITPITFTAEGYIYDASSPFQQAYLTDPSSNSVKARYR